jgi:hypothetical protein
VIILEHNHTREVITMGVNSAHQHAIFLDYPEPCLRYAV